MAARVCTLALAGILAIVAAPAAGVAKPCAGQTTAPPGQSEVDQYAETVPGTCGDQTGNPGDPGGSGGGGEPNAETIPAATAEQLDSLGADGQATAALTKANAPRGGTPGGSGQGATAGGESDGDTGSGAATEGGPSSLGAIVDAVSGSDDGEGLGALLPLILAAIAGAGGAYVVLRRRAGREG